VYYDIFIFYLTDVGVVALHIGEREDVCEGVAKVTVMGICTFHTNIFKNMFIAVLTICFISFNQLGQTLLTREGRVLSKSDSNEQYFFQEYLPRYV